MSDSPITLRRAVPADAAAFVRTMADPAVMPQLLQLPYPSLEMWSKRIAEHEAPGKTDLLLVAERAGEVVGNAGLHPAVQLRRRHVAMLGIVVAGPHIGTGVGTALMKGLLDYADRWGQILRIELTVFADNRRAIHLYERFGFEHEGRGRAFALREGRYDDVLFMARLHPSPPTLG